MGTVCSATLLWGLVDLDVLDDEVSGIETLGIGVGLSVLEETEEELSRLDWPSSARNTELLSYNSRSHQNTASPISRISPWSFSPCAARPVPPA